MFHAEIDSTKSIKVTFGYSKFRKEIKGKKFVRRTSVATLQLLVMGNEIEDKISGSATNHSEDRFVRRVGRKHALDKALNLPEQFIPASWQGILTDAVKEKILFEYKLACPE